MTYAATDKSSDRMPPFVQSGQSVTIELHVDDVLAAYDWVPSSRFQRSCSKQGVRSCHLERMGRPHRTPSSRQIAP